MQCERARDLLGAFLDDELAPEERDDVAAHLETCKACRAIVADYERLGRSVRAHARVEPPAGLDARVLAALKVVDAAAAPNTLNVTAQPLVVADARASRAAQRRWIASASRYAAAMAASCILTAVATWWIVDTAKRGDRIQQEVLNAHIRSLLQESPVQVASSEQHTVRPWFAGRADFAPDVKDLAAQGYPLVGGRLDYVADRRVAVVVYSRHLHVINVFMWTSATNTDEAPRAELRAGYNLLTWSRNGLTYRAISDLNVGELMGLQTLL